MASVREPPSPIALYFDAVLQERLRASFPAGARVLDLGGGSGRAAEGLEAAGVRVMRLALDAPPPEGGPYDGAFATGAGAFPPGNGVAWLAEALRPGAPVILRVVPRPGAGPRDVRRAMGPAFLWGSALALGLVVPSEARGAWAERYPQTFGVLAAVEGVLRRWPVLRFHGRAVVLEGVRR